jgi:hypothetical protein
LLLAIIGRMTATKRPNRVESWIPGLRKWLSESAPRRPIPAPAAKNAFGEAIDGMDLCRDGDRRVFAVATCLYKATVFLEAEPYLIQIPSAGAQRFYLWDPRIATPAAALEHAGLRELALQLKPRRAAEISFLQEAPIFRRHPAYRARRFELLDVRTQTIVSDEFAFDALSELVTYPRARWITELHIALVLRLHRAGFRPGEIAGLLRSDEQPATTRTHPGAKAVEMLIRKYDSAPRHDLGATPASWSLRLPAPARAT